MRHVTKMVRSEKSGNVSVDVVEHKVSWITKSFSPLMEHRLLLKDVSHFRTTKGFSEDNSTSLSVTFEAARQQYVAFSILNWHSFNWLLLIMVAVYTNKCLLTRKL